MVRIPAASAVRVLELLELLSELPSSADVVAVGAHEAARGIAARLPFPKPGESRDPQRPGADVVELSDEDATELVELLDLFAALPSTPPPVARDATRQAADLAAQIAAEDVPVA